jgi:N-carbamoyl-L-amino-acid hydrolase
MAARVEIDGDALLGWMDDISAFGATPGGGLDRQSLSEPEIAARLWFTKLGRQLGFAVFSDPIGNIFLRAEGSDPLLPPFVAGSHLDSQPFGGRYDGTLGVLTALAAADAIKRANLLGARSLEVVSWTNEEGSRFKPGAMGSRAFVNPKVLPQYLQERDNAGVTVGEGVRSWQDAAGNLVTARDLGFAVAGYVEVHIEQGPMLEDAGLLIGAVTGIQGIRRYVVEIDGFAGHAGTTPNAARRDAFMQAVEIVYHLRHALNDSEDRFRFTIGQMSVLPGGISVIPDHVTFTIDLRHPVTGQLDRATNTILDACERLRGPCVARVREVSRSAPQVFAEPVLAAIEQTAAEFGYGCTRISSGAGHDAGPMNTVCPSGMIFVPCRQGISHNESEHAEPEHMIAGANVLAGTLLALMAHSLH